MKKNIKISVFVGGAQKSGTRSLSQYFRLHPNLAVHQKREGHFFDRHENFINNFFIPSALDNYYANYVMRPETKILCDITPDYIYRKNAIQRIYNYNQSAIWVILLRNPIERAYSAWNMEVNRKAENLPFEEALMSEINANSSSRVHDRFHYLERSRYYTQLKRLWKYFPRSHCYIVSAESVWENPNKSLNSILNLLNINTNINQTYKHIHKGSYKDGISINARNFLYKELEFEMTELPSLLGWSKNPWIQET